jgi:alcohol dehydrogenase class IV
VEKVDIPTNLESFGVKKGDIDFLVQAGSQQTRLLVNNCKELSLADIRYIYNKLF